MPSSSDAGKRFGDGSKWGTQERRRQRSKSRRPSSRSVERRERGRSAGRSGVRFQHTKLEWDCKNCKCMANRFTRRTCRICGALAPKGHLVDLDEHEQRVSKAKAGGKQQRGRERSKSRPAADAEHGKGDAERRLQQRERELERKEQRHAREAKELAERIAAEKL